MSVRLVERIGMMIRGIPVNEILRYSKIAKKHNFSVTIPMLEAHHLASGDCEQVLNALQLAKKHGIEIEWIQACGINLFGRDAVDAIQKCIPEHESTFNTYDDDSNEPIIGYCRNRDQVYGGIYNNLQATCLTYFCIQFGPNKRETGH